MKYLFITEKISGGKDSFSFILLPQVNTMKTILEPEEKVFKPFSGTFHSRLKANMLIFK